MDVANSASGSQSPGAPNVIFASHHAERISHFYVWDTFYCQARGHVLKELINYIVSG